jgi:NADH dehydrogenase
VRPRIVIVGAGFAGLNAAHALRRADADADADVTIVDGHDYHTFQPLLYQVSTGYLRPEQVGAALRAVFRRQANVRVRIGKASGLDYPAHVLVLQGGSRLDLDYLIVAAGAEANFFGIPDLREHGWPLYTLADTISLRRHLLSTLEQAAARHDAGPINVVVAGGSSTGVETAGALTSMARELGESAARLQVTLMEATRQRRWTRVDKQWNGQWRYGAVGRRINAAGRSDAGKCHRAEPSVGLTTEGNPMATGSYLAVYAGGIPDG